jgi:two-component system KDP operon response regulator KdpE
MIKSRIIVAGSPNPRLTQLKAMLESDGHRVAATGNPRQTIHETTGGMHDVLILDSGMEGMCEYDLCRTIRPKSDLGIILLIRDNDGQSRIDALDAGADDYLATPFVPAELLARVRALLRRVAQTGARKPKLILSDRLVDLQSHQVIGPASRVAHLTPKEFNVLRYLFAHANKSVSHHMIASAVWQRDGYGDFEYLRVVIGQLRRKLELNPELPRHIVTDRSSGYRLQIPPQDDGMETEAIAVPPLTLRAVRTGIPAMVQ